MRCGFTLLCVLSLSFLSACGTTSPQEVTAVKQTGDVGNCEHAPSRFQFPPKVAGFERELSRQNDRHASVDYNHAGQHVHATVDIYPVSQEAPDNTLSGRFAACKADLVKNISNARLVSEGSVKLSPGGHKQKGLHVCYTSAECYEFQRQGVGREIYLFRRGPWFIEFFIDYPLRQKAAAEPAIKKFIDELAWP